MLEVDFAEVKVSSMEDILVFLHFWWVGIFPPSADSWDKGMDRRSDDFRPLYGPSPFAALLFPGSQATREWVLKCQEDNANDSVRQAAQGYATKHFCNEYVAHTEKRDGPTLRANAHMRMGIMGGTMLQLILEKGAMTNMMFWMVRSLLRCLSTIPPNWCTPCPHMYDYALKCMHLCRSPPNSAAARQQQSC